MKLSRIFSAQVVGLRTHTITIETDLFNGFHTFSIVGLADKAVDESRDRVSSAIKSAGFASPKSEGQQKVVVSLAPADLKKEGPLFDLPIALGYLLAAEEVAFDPTGRLFVGELSLSGELRPIKGALLIARHAREAGFTELYVPSANASEAALVEGVSVYGAETLAQVVAHLSTKPRPMRKDTPAVVPLSPAPHTPFAQSEEGEVHHAATFADIEGQEAAKRGLAIAAAGGHNIAFYGPPGTGKTLLARAFASILPALSFDEALEVTGIHSAAGALHDEALITVPPFRAPHHTSSFVSVIGGGTYPKPGEATLAHRGVLFLDEFPEFDRRVIESLREPLEDRRINISRSKGSETFPAGFILVAALNPCPCGFKGDPVKPCTCPPNQLDRYRRKVSGPIVDRIDMWIEVPRIDNTLLSRTTREDAAERARRADEVTALRARIVAARERQRARFAHVDAPITLNSALSARDLSRVVLSQEAKDILDAASRRLSLSSRAYHRLIKLARTIADLEGAEHIAPAHILEAVQYRPKEM